MAAILLWMASLVAGLVAYFCYGIFRPGSSKRRQQDQSPKRIVYAFFHPHASGGGGGERVLWKMIQFLQSSQHRCLRCGTMGKKENDNEIENDNDDEVEIVIFTIDPPSTKERDLRLDAERRFDVSIPKKVRLVSLQEYKDYLSPRPFLSMVMESWGTMKLARRALLETILNKEQSGRTPYSDCDEFIFCDTTGCAFTFAVVRWMCWATTVTTIRILAYVHYPTISTDMMLWEWQKSKSNNTGTTTATISIQTRIRTILKLGYYYLFSVAYGLCGSLADLVMVNSTWTYNHIHSLWRFRSAIQRKEQPIQIVYPPCRIPVSDNDVNDGSCGDARENTIVSIGQFRPEKNHKLQIQALSVLFKQHPELKENQIQIHQTDDSNSATLVKLLLIGSCRNDSDRARVDELKKLVNELDLNDHVVFSINPPYHELQASMHKASIGIHTMRQEHFGIGIVEMMAGGLLTIAHDSGGPKSDIIVDVTGSAATGFLATTAEEYAEAMHKALTLDTKEADAMRQRAKISAERFSDEAFDKSLEKVFPLLYRC